MSAVPVVLVVEDNSELRSVLTDALAEEGYQVLGAQDEAEARGLLRDNRVDLLISDLTGPPNAKQALEAVKEDFPDLPVVALSETTSPHPPFFFGAWQNPRAIRTLSKPFRLAQLLAVSREMLDAGPQP